MPTPAQSPDVCCRFEQRGATRNADLWFKPGAKVICDHLYCLVSFEYSLLPRQSKIPQRPSADSVAMFTIFHFHNPDWRLEITGQQFSLIQAFFSIFQNPLQFYVLSVSLVLLVTIITPLLPHLAQISGQWMGRIIPELTWLLLRHMEFLNPLSDFRFCINTSPDGSILASVTTLL